MSSSRTGRGFDAAALEMYQVCRAVAASHAGSVAWPNLVPVVARFGATRPACVIHGTVLALGGWIGKRTEREINRH